MAVSIQKLKNGITVILDQFESNTLSIGLWLDVGSVNENEKQLGIAHMLEHMAFKGTAKRNSFQIAKEIEDVGGDINAYTSKESTAYYVKLLSENVNLGIEILSDIFLNSTFPVEEIERERGVIISEIGQSNDMPDDKVFDNFYKLGFKNQSIGKAILGTKESVSNFKKEDLRVFCSKYYNSSNLIIGLSGKFKSEIVMDLIKEKFQKINIGTKSKKPKYYWHSGNHFEKKQLEQSHIILGVEGLSIKDENRMFLNALSIILGGGMSSRLFQELREKKGVCYTIFSFLQQFSSSGIFGIYSACNPKNLNELITSSLYNINHLKKNINNDDLNRAKAQMKASYIRAQDYTFNRLETNVRNLIHHNKLFSEREILTKIENVSIENLLNTYEKIFDNPKFVVSIVGPEDKNLSDLNISL